MPSSSLIDDDYTSVAESPVPGWRKDAMFVPIRERMSGRRRLRHVIQHPAGIISISLAEDADNPQWLKPTLEGLSDLVALPEDWNSYGARSVTLHAVAGVIRLLSLIMTDTIPIPAFVPTQAGGIQVEWHTRGVDLEIGVSRTGRYHASLEDSASATEWAGDVTTDLHWLHGVLAKLA